jgi:hypothetical protein
VTTGRQGDTDGVGKGLRRTILGLVQLKVDLREVVELGDGVARDLGLDAAFKYSVEKSVD